MGLYEFWSSLTNDEKQEYAKKSGYKASYINLHLIHKRKTPPLVKIKRMADASNGKLKFDDLCDFFIQQKPPSGN